ncbi:DUF4157 domain-containing protein [Streptomyces sp. NBC_00212]|uniref:eCIS core domain-containing protein n=1 Tax=Streptomyces sp. NBC_00212 TaxID=2975684 RepID=UPI003247B3B5
MHANEQAQTPNGKKPARTASRTPAPGGGIPAGLLALQSSAGNAAVVQMLRQAGHPWAQEQHQHNAGCGHQQTEQPAVQRSAVHDVLRTGGRPMDDATRTDMETRLGADFSDVRIHNDSAAKASAAEVGARAYTSGNHVVIGDGGGDKHTLAHELTHVIQQRRGPVAGTDNGGGLKVSDPSDRFEREAETSARRALGGQPPARHNQSAGPGGEASELGTAVQRMNAATQEAAQGRLERMHERAEGRDGQPTVPAQTTQENSPFGPYTFRRSPYGPGPYVQSNGNQHPGAGTVGERYTTLLAHLRSPAHLRALAQATKGGTVSPAALNSMTPTQKRAAAVLYGIVTKAEEIRFAGAAKPFRAALLRLANNTGPNGVDEFLDRFPMAQAGGAHAYTGALTNGAYQNLADMSDSSGDESDHESDSMSVSSDSYDSEYEELQNLAAEFGDNLMDVSPG